MIREKNKKGGVKREIMKKVKMKRIYVYAIHRKLKQIPPKFYPSTDEIKTTIELIIPALKEHIGEYLKMMDEVDKTNHLVRKKKITEDERRERLEKMKNSWDEYNNEHGEDVVEVEFEEDAFKAFREQFEREPQNQQEPDVWGKDWLANIDEYDELSKAIEEAEESKSKKKRD